MKSQLFSFLILFCVSYVTSTEGTDCFESGKGYAGSDYKRIKDITTADDCQKSCYEDTKCKVWTLNTNTGSYWRGCWLHNAVPGVQYGSTLIRGPRECLEVTTVKPLPASCVVRGEGYSGNNYKHMQEVMTPAECQRNCERDTECAVWTLNTHPTSYWRGCWLHNKEGHTKSGGTLVRGPKKCSVIGYGDKCSTSAECKGALGDMAMCGFTSTCICRDGYKYTDGTCQRVIGYGDKCKSSAECKGALGDMAMCLRVSQDTDGTCQRVIGYGDRCSSDAECKGALGGMAMCGFTCICRDGYQYTDGTCQLAAITTAKALPTAAKPQPTAAKPQPATNNPACGPLEAIKWCNLSCANTMCVYQGPNQNCPITQSAGPSLTDAEKKAVLDAHNKLRQKVARGNEPGLPAANKTMPDLLWDDDLAKVALRWTTQCKFDHDKNRATPEFPGAVGQNMYMSSHPRLPKWTETHRPSYRMVYAINSWYKKELEFYLDFENNVNRFEAADLALTGHFTQVIWQKTTHVGCGYVWFGKPGQYKFLLTCNYGPSGNWPGAPVYQ